MARDDAKVAAVLADIADGESLRAAAVKAGTKPSTFLLWVDNDPLLAEQYARAKASGMECRADEILEIADETTVVAMHEGKEVTLAMDSVAIQRNRLRVDSRKWLLSKLAPKRYGEKIVQEHTGPGGGPIQTRELSLADRAARIAALLATAAPPKLDDDGDGRC